jgi:DNA-binding transcriptional LysR family regulator
VPDLFSSTLPDILREFGRAYPRIEVELRLMRAVHLHTALRRKELDLILAARVPDVDGGRFVGHMPLVWVASVRDHPETIDPLPLAVLPPGAIARQIMLDMLDKFGRPWRVVSVTDSFAGLHAAVAAGLAVTAIPQCQVQPDMRILRANDQVPMLCPVELLIHHRAGAVSPAAANFAEFIARRFRTLSTVEPGRPGRQAYPRRRSATAGAAPASAIEGRRRRADRAAESLGATSAISMPAPDGAESRGSFDPCG